jgi:hypothetical protein
MEWLKVEALSSKGVTKIVLWDSGLPRGYHFQG